MMVKNLFVLMLLVCSLTALRGQSGTFDAGLVAGLNFAELEGDGIMDYFGPNAGLLGRARLSNHFELGVEILYSQNGEYVLPEFYPQVRFGRVRLHHLEVPVYLSKTISLSREHDYVDLRCGLGLAYARLLGFHAEDLYRNELNPCIRYGNLEALLMQAHLTFQLSRHLGVNLKATLPVRRERLDWTLASRLVYTLG